MTTADILNGIMRVSHGLLRLPNARPFVNDPRNPTLRATPIFPSAGRPLPTGGYTNVATGAVSYWASLPSLELPDTNLTPHYLEDFIAHPPMDAA